MRKIYNQFVNTRTIALSATAGLLCIGILLYAQQNNNERAASENSISANDLSDLPPKEAGEENRDMVELDMTQDRQAIIQSGFERLSDLHQSIHSTQGFGDEDIMSVISMCVDARSIVAPHFPKRVTDSEILSQNPNIDKENLADFILNYPNEVANYIIAAEKILEHYQQEKNSNN